MPHPCGLTLPNDKLTRTLLASHYRVEHTEAQRSNGKGCPCVRVEGLNPEHSRTQMQSIHLCPDLPTVPACAARSPVHLPRLWKSTPLTATVSALGECFQNTPWKWPVVT